MKALTAITLAILMALSTTAAADQCKGVADLAEAMMNVSQSPRISLEYRIGG